LDELRSDLARAIGDFANQNFADRYGPLVGSVAENTAEQILRDFELNGVKAKKEAEFVAKELVDRIIRGLSKYSNNCFNSSGRDNYYDEQTVKFLP
jgi:hypothetical protein